MFGMSMTEMLIIGIVALLVIGPKDLPKMAKTLGKTLRDVRRAGDDLKESFEREVMEERPMPKGPPPGALAKDEPASLAPAFVPTTQGLNAPPAPLPAAAPGDVPAAAPTEPKAS